MQLLSRIDMDVSENKIILNTKIHPLIFWDFQKTSKISEESLQQSHC